MSNDMESKGGEEKSNTNTWPWIVGGLIITVVLGCFWYHLWSSYLVTGNKEGIAAIGAAGDSFGVAASLFSALGFIGLIYTILQQQKSINIQADDLRQTRKEIEGQTEQFKKTYALEKNAKVVAARPDMEVFDSKLILIEDGGGEHPFFVFLLSIENHGATIRDCWFCNIQIPIENLILGAEKRVQADYRRIQTVDTSIKPEAHRREKIEVKINQKWEYRPLELAKDTMIILNLEYSDILGLKRCISLNFEVVSLLSGTLIQGTKRNGYFLRFKAQKVNDTDSIVNLTDPDL